MTNTNDATIATTYRAMAAYIAEHGLAKGTDGDHGGPRCTIGALRSSAGDLATIRRTYHDLLDRLPIRSVGEWSDAQDAETVIATLLNFAAELDPDAVITVATTAEEPVMA